jgi:hypothetical protein
MQRRIDLNRAIAERQLERRLHSAYKVIENDFKATAEEHKLCASVRSFVFFLLCFVCCVPYSVLSLLLHSPIYALSYFLSATHCQPFPRQVLLAHIEKLMKYVKIEATGKARAMEAMQKAKSDVVVLKQTLEKKNRLVLTEKR